MDIGRRLAADICSHVVGCLSVARELQRIESVSSVGAPEAVIFHCSRILEGLTGAALAALNLRASPNVFDNLGRLESYRLLHGAPLAWAHALRRVGNEVRHLLRDVQEDDAAVAMALVERVVAWYFRDFSSQPRAALTTDGRPFFQLPAASASLIDEVWSQRDGALLREALAPAVLARATPVFAQMLAQRLVAEASPEAAPLIAAALQRFPGDATLLLREAIRCSRTGEFDRSLEVLIPLHCRYRTDDEVIGVLAGVYKRRWWDDPTRRRDLEESHRLYRGAWERQPVGVGNPYPGINAAATARWLGDRTGALALAGQVYALLTTREATLAVLRPGHRTPDDYWDRVTLAEAHLLLERPEEARRVYREAFRAHAQRLSDIGASLGQAARLLATQYGEDESARFVASLTVVDTEEP